MINLENTHSTTSTRRNTDLREMETPNKATHFQIIFLKYHRHFYDILIFKILYAFLSLGIKRNPQIRHLGEISRRIT